MKKYFIKFLLIVVLFVSCKSTKKKDMERENFNFHTDYNQFYLEDSGEDENIDIATIWTSDAYFDRLGINESVISIRTATWGNVKGEINILNTPKEFIDYDLYDHIVEAGINIKSGKIDIVSCPIGDVIKSINVKPNHYRVRVYSLNLKSVKETDMYNETDNDYYKIEIWPDDNMERKVLKKYVDQ